MTSPDLSPELAALLRGSRPEAPAELRARVRRIATPQAAASAPIWTRMRLPNRRLALVVLPAAAALAIVSAGVLGLARSDVPTTEALVDQSVVAEKNAYESIDPRTASPALPTWGASDPALPSPGAATGAVAQDRTRKQRVNATMTVEVADSDGVADSAQKAIALAQRLGGHVVSSTVVTGEGANAALTLRVPVTRVQEAVAGLSALGTIVSQQVSIEDLQATLDQFDRRERSLRTQIALHVARLEAGTLSTEARIRFESRLEFLRSQLRGLRTGIAGLNAEARMATIQMTVVTADGSGAAPVPSRLDRTLDEALNVLVWEGVVALAILIVAAPFALLALVLWLGNRLYRRREDDRLLTAN